MHFQTLAHEMSGLFVLNASSPSRPVSRGQVKLTLTESINVDRRARAPVVLSTIGTAIVRIDISTSLSRDGQGVLAPGGLNVERVRSLLHGDRCPLREELGLEDIQMEIGNA